MSWLKNINKVTLANWSYYLINTHEANLSNSRSCKYSLGHDIIGTLVVIIQIINVLDLVLDHKCLLRLILLYYHSGVSI